MYIYIYIVVDYFPMISPWLTSHCWVCLLRVWPTAIPIGMPLPERRIRPERGPKEAPQETWPGNHIHICVFCTHTHSVCINMYIYIYTNCILYIKCKINIILFLFIYIYIKKVNNVYVYIYILSIHSRSHFLLCKQYNIMGPYWPRGPSSALP